MDDQKRQIIEKLQGAKNVLVTVSNDPSVDQLAACIALTLMLNKLDKHATAVYSGETPSTIEFLQPEETIEKNTDSLRDFIISLDKAKADKLRYKVEEKVVKIFITPYRTSLSDKDLNFSQGDFNVDVVIGLGVHKQQDLDQAITAHGRILHDAVVATVNNTPDGDLGSIHWQDLSASSLSEQVASMAHDLGDNLLDQQIATALLTGIVAETARFSNTKTSPRTMSLSAELMAAGANQQLVASKLEQGSPDKIEHGDKSSDYTPKSQAPDNGELSIQHQLDGVSATNEPDLELPAPELPTPNEQSAPSQDASSSTPSDGGLKPLGPGPKASGDHQPSTPKLMTEPPLMGGTLTANSVPESLDPSTDPLSLPQSEAPLLNRTSSSASASNDRPADNPLPPLPSLSSRPPFPPADNSAKTDDSTSTSDSGTKNYDHETLTQIEDEVHHEEQEKVSSKNAAAAVAAAEDLDSARQAVEDAIKSSVESAPPEPIDALGAQPVDLPGLGGNSTPPSPPLAPPSDQPFVSPLSPAPEPPPFSFNGATATPVNTTPPPPPAAPSSANEPAPLAGSPADQPFTMPLPPNLNVPPADTTPPTDTPAGSPQAPPPVPPPMMPPGFGPPPSQ